MDWLSPLSVAALSGGIGAAIGAMANRRKNRAEEAVHYAHLASDARKELEREHALRRSLVAGSDALQREVLRLREREGQLGRAANRLADLNGLGLVLDCISPQGVALSGAAGGGTFLWVNIAFCAALGYTRAQVLEQGWRGLCHPDDQEDTKASEGAAYDDPVGGFVNRFRRADGGWAQLRWHATKYVGGVSVCVVEFERLPTAEPQ